MPRGTTSQIRRRSRRAAQREVGSSSARVALRETLLADGEIQPTLLTNYDLAHGSPAHHFFHKAAIEAGFDALSTAWWPTEETLTVREDTVFRVDATDQVIRLEDGTLALLRGGGGSLSVVTAGPSGEAAVEALRAAYPAAYLTMGEDNRVPITFWSMGEFGPSQRLRRIEAQPWEDVAANYPAAVRSELERAMAWESGDDASGQLLLWQGLPGTGKTWALRALASQWAPWAEFHYITDPDVFFGQKSSYMVDVLLSDSYMALEPDSGDVYDEQASGGKWKILILEDTGDLLASNARDSYSAGLSRLLNVVDGMIGQGLRVLALVTTNDQLDDFHPAVIRPGRCAQQLSFGPLDAEEASAWLGETVEQGGTLAELYARRGAGLEAELAMGACADCDHAFAAHTGKTGPCTTDGCDCTGYASQEEVAASGRIGTAFVRIRPDMTHFQAEVDGYVQAAMARSAAALERDVADVLLADIPDEHAQTIRLRLGELRIVDGRAELAPVVTPIPPEHQPGEQLPPPRRAVKPPARRTEKIPLQPDEGNGPSNASIVRWQAILCPEGSPTDDGRIFAPGAMDWRTLPLTLMAMIETQPGHDGAQVSGRIDRIWRDGANVMGEGVFDAGEFGQDIARMVGDGTLRGVSVDIAILAMEVTYRSNVLDADGNWIAKPADVQEADDDEGLDPPALPDSPREGDELMLVVWRGKIGAATVCPFPAFEHASIELAELSAGGPSNPLHWRYKHDGDWALTIRQRPIAEVALMASALTDLAPVRYLDLIGPSSELVAGADDVPMQPPAEWFDAPQHDRLTGLTIDDDGRVSGYAAPWGTCHIGIPDACTTAPRSLTGYSYFHLKEVELDDGRRVSCGTITMDTRHAGTGVGRVAATRHYDDTGTAVAQVRVGEDEHGIWVVGAVMPGLDDEAFRMLRGAVLSGDWRNVDGNLELVALLCVNVAGFPVPRGPEASIVASGGRVIVESLISAGLGEPVVTDGDRERLRALLAGADGTFDDILDRTDTVVSATSFAAPDGVTVTVG